MDEILKKIGLSDKEAAIYLATLRTGETGANDLARTTGIQRTDCFGVASKLAERGYLTKNKKGRQTLFSATPPQVIATREEQRYKLFMDSVPALKELIPQTSKSKSTVKYFEGPRGIDELSKRSEFAGGELLVFSPDEFLNKDNGFYKKSHIDLRVKSKTFCRMLISVSTEALEIKRNDKAELRETRILPRTIFHPKTTIAVYKHRVFVINYKNQFGFIAEDADLAETLTQIFELVWASGKVMNEGH
jgi:sugar-specific transcriptional regulator TrmB